MVVAGKLLVDTFGNQEIGDIVKNFDFSKIDVKDTRKDDYLHRDLAPAYGSLDRGQLSHFDDKLKVMIAGTVQILSKLRPEDRRYDNVLTSMMQNPLTEPRDNEDRRADQIYKNSADDFKFDGSPNAAIVNELLSWLTSLIRDDEVIKSLQLDNDVMAKIVAQTGAIISGIGSSSERNDKSLIDVGVLQFPDINNPFFKLYRIKLAAWSDKSRILFHAEDKCGLNVEYSARRFKPRDSVLDSLTPQARDRAAQMASQLFD